MFNSKEELGRILVKEIKDLRKSKTKFRGIDYDTHLDETFGEVTVGTLKFPTSEALKELDLTAYSEGMAEWSIDSLYQGTLGENDEQ